MKTACLLVTTLLSFLCQQPAAQARFSTRPVLSPQVARASHTVAASSAQADQVTAQQLPVTDQGGAVCAYACGNGTSVVLVYWGWHGNDPSGEAPYLESFLKALARSDLISVVAQYAPPPSLQVGHPFSYRDVLATTGIVNFPGQEPSWTGRQPFQLLPPIYDDSPIPATPSKQQMADEADKYADRGTIVLIATPTGVTPPDFGTVNCAYHANAPYTPFIVVPYETDQPVECASSDSNPLGRVSWAAEHELAEVMTDSDGTSGWYDQTAVTKKPDGTTENNGEIGDKCNTVVSDVVLDGNSYQVQSLWSNAADGGTGACVFYGYSPFLSASPVPSEAVAGPGPGTTTITWDTGDGSNGQICVAQDNGPCTVIARSGYGSMDYTIQTGSTYEFDLSGGQTHPGTLRAIVVKRAGLIVSPVSAFDTTDTATVAWDTGVCPLTSYGSSEGTSCDDGYVSSDGSTGPIGQGPIGSVHDTCLASISPCTYTLYDTATDTLLASVRVQPASVSASTTVTFDVTTQTNSSGTTTVTWDTGNGAGGVLYYSDTQHGLGATRLAQGPSGSAMLSGPFGDYDFWLVAPDGTKIAETTLAPMFIRTGALRWPQGVAIDNKGNVYIGDTGDDQVLRVASAGAAVIMGTMTNPAALAVDGDGNVYAVDPSSNSQVIELAADGSQHAVAHGSAVAVDSTNTIYIAQAGQILKIDAQGRQATLSTGVSQPGALAIDQGGTIYIADYATNTIVVLNPDATRRIIPFSFAGPVGLAVDGAGALYVTDYRGNQVVKIIGTTESPLPVQGLNGPAAVAVDGAGDVYIADSGNNRIVELPANGTQIVLDVSGASSGPTATVTPTATFSVTATATLTTTPTVTDTPSPTPMPTCTAPTQSTLLASGLSNPSAVAVDAVCDVFIVDASHNQVVEVPAGHGTPVTVASGLNQPDGVAMDGSGTLYIADTGNKRVLKLVAGGSAPVPMPITGLCSPEGMATDSAGNLYIADGCGSQIVKVTPAGVQSTVGGHPYDPDAVAVDGAGNVYIASFDGNQVLKMTPSGAQSTLGINLYGPAGLAVDSTGTVYISDYFHARVLAVTAAGVQFRLPLTGLNHPSGLALDSAGTLYVADLSNNRVLSVSNPGTNTGWTAAGFNGPAGVAVDRAGDTFVSDTLNNRIVEISAAGVHTIVQGATSLDQPDGVAVDSSGNLYIADTGNQRVVKVTPAGTETTMPVSGLSSVLGAAVDSTGDLYIADESGNQVIRLAPNGAQNPVTLSGLDHPSGVAVDAAGNLYVSNAYSGTVLKLTPGGVQTTILSGLTYPSIGVAADGTVYASDWGRHQVVRLSTSGEQSTVLVGQLNNPAGVAVDSSGTLYVADYSDNRVVKLTASGMPSNL